MRIKNISEQTLTIPFKFSNGMPVVVTIQPGQIIYCEPKAEENKQVVIYCRKNKLEITQDEKPKNAQFYHPYGILPHSEVVKLKKENVVLHIDVDEEEGEGESEVEEVIESEESPEMEEDVEIEESIEDIEDKPKNKGGRPAG